ncbi:MAG TPA: hypothetical protein PK798_07310 [Flavobacteriales bacterium]|nr:hypothetical protein [Flavobacteriales bacterium]HRJ38581.1 hypothetical protein [Flavobacteriales bacterium]
MLITYLIVLIIAIVFKLLHFPGAGLIFVISPLFPFLDVIIQSFRDKGDQETRLLSSIGVFLISLFLLVKFLFWPYALLFFCLAFAVTSLFVFRFFRKKANYNIRFFITTLLFLFAIFNFSLKSSSFRLTYLLEDPFNPDDPVPHFYIQSLAYEYYLEGDYNKAEKLIERNINHIADLLKEEDVPPGTQEMDSANLEISKNDLEEIQNRSWTNSLQLYPEDRYSYEKFK